MNTSLFHSDNYLRAVLDALPSAVFVVDYEFNIFDLNSSASDLYGIDSDVILRRLCGDVMHCMHAIESVNGCGTTEYCPDCVIRNSVEMAFKGKTIKRAKYQMKIEKKEDLTDVHMLVSASPFNYEDANYVIVAIENITEVITLKRLLPICSNCYKIRNDEDYWEAVDGYLKKHADLEFTHGICPECAYKLYPDLDL